MNAVSFGPDGNPVAAGGCARPGVAGVFTDAGGTWRSAGLALPGMGPAQVLGLGGPAGGNTALLAAGNSLLTAWWDGTRWTVSAPIAASRLTTGPATATPVTASPGTANTVRALGFGPGRGAWVLLSGGRAESIGGPGRAWQALPPVPTGTGTLAPGPGGSYDALAVAGSRLAVWRLGPQAWTMVQQITVPVQFGSSG